MIRTSALWLAEVEPEAATRRVVKNEAFTP